MHILVTCYLYLKKPFKVNTNLGLLSLSCIPYHLPTYMMCMNIHPPELNTPTLPIFLFLQFFFLHRTIHTSKAKPPTHFQLFIKKRVTSFSQGTFSLSLQTLLKALKTASKKKKALFISPHFSYPIEHLWSECWQRGRSSNCNKM